jgi:signal transduction histidine kinase
MPPAGGLRNMRDRIEAIGGRLTIESAPGRGTRILALVPVD